jgi:endonuclease G
LRARANREVMERSREEGAHGGQVMMGRLDPDVLAASAARFGNASGRLRRSFDERTEGLDGLTHNDRSLDERDRGIPDADTDSADADVMTRPEVTPSTAKPIHAHVNARVADILRAAASASGRDVDVRASLSEERIIGRGDLQNVAYLEVGVAVARGVARIRIGGGSGTGSLIGPRILMTNHHVISATTDIDDATRAEFDVQDDSDGRPLPRQNFTLDPTYFWLTSKELDFTLVGMAPYSETGCAAANYPWTRISPADKDLNDRDALTIIQHPLGGMKQIAFRNNDVIVVKDLKDFLHYTTDTQQGSSGSPCFDDLWRLVALHHSSVPATNAAGEILTRDGKVYRRGIDRADAVRWIANEGARMSAVATAIREAVLASTEMERLRADFLGEKKPPNPVVVAREALAALQPQKPPEPAPNEGSRRRAGKGGVTITVNLMDDQIRGVHIERDGDDAPVAIRAAVAPAASVRRPAPIVPAPAAPTEQPAPAEQAAGLDEAIVIDPDWQKRKGYDPDFLGVTIPLPTLSADQQQLTLKVPDQYLKRADDPYVFKYHHYSLAFHKRRHIAWYSAANVHGGQREHKYTREKDRWFFDPRMDDRDQPIHQLGEPLYSAANTDRGHLTRYLDVQWGATLDETRKATNDSFHFSNCALQVSAFNQGKDRWQGIEQFLLEKKARNEKRQMVVITGPILRATDPLYRTADMEQAVRVPLSFWKLAAIVPKDDRPLAVTAFVLGQPEAAELDDIEEKFDVTAVQITVAKLAKLTGFTFAKILTDNDHFAKQGPGSLEAVGLMRDDDIIV